MKVIVVIDETGPLISKGETGKVPDYFVRNLRYGPGKFRTAISVIPLIAKRGPTAWKAYMRWFTYVNRYRLGIVAVGGGLLSIGTETSNVAQNINQARSYFFKSRTKRKHHAGHPGDCRCEVCRC